MKSPSERLSLTREIQEWAYLTWTCLGIFLKASSLATSPVFPRHGGIWLPPQFHTPLSHSCASLFFHFILTGWLLSSEVTALFPLLRGYAIASSSDDRMNEPPTSLGLVPHQVSDLQGIPLQPSM